MSTACEEKLPFISIVVPVFNEESYIARCAEALLSQSYPTERYEVIIVDNNSTDQSAEIARRIDGIRVVSEPIQGDFAARNRGIAEARGEIIAFTDSDTAPRPEWLAQIARVLMERPDVGVIVGGLQFNGASPTLDLLAAYEEDKSDYIFNSDDPGIYFGYTCNLAARRCLFDELGPFAPVQRNADVVFVRAVVDAHSTAAVVYESKVAVLRLEVDSVRAYLQKQMIYGNDFPRYARLANARSLTMSERIGIFRHVISKRHHGCRDTILLLATLVAGAICYDVSRWLSRQRQGPTDGEGG